MKLTHLILIAGLIFITSTANADVELLRFDKAFPNSNTNPNLFIGGEIKTGDYEKAVDIVEQVYSDGEIANLYVTLDSPGGDVLEAIKIGNLIGRLMLSTSALNTQCYSACVFIYVAGSTRYASTGLGIHRPFFDKKYFSGLSADDAKIKYDNLFNSIDKYLTEMGVAKELIEKMFRTPSNELEMLSLDEIEKWISWSPAALGEWLIAKCGSYTDEEEQDFALHQAQRVKLRPGYANYLIDKITKVNNCRRGEIILERNHIAAKMFPKSNTVSTK